ncbi:MAG: EI24 domain-containing protein [bacterium]|nr:EI24 domain-containing protein [bacterium]
MRFLRNLIFGYKSYIKAIKFIFEHKLYWFFLIPAVLMLVIYKIGDWIQSRYIPTDAQNMNEIVWFLIQVMLELTLAFLLMKFAKYLVIIILSPLLSEISMRTEKILTGNTYPFNFKQLVADVKRAMRIVVRNMMWEYTIFVVILLVTYIISGSKFGESPLFYLTYLVGCFYYGFGFMDYVLERVRMDIDQSIHFVRDHRGVAVALGSIYSLMIFVPVDVGILFNWSNFEFLPFLLHLGLWACASVAPILTIVATTIAMDGLVDLKTNVYSQKIDTLEVEES